MASGGKPAEGGMLTGGRCDLCVGLVLFVHSKGRGEKMDTKNEMLAFLRERFPQEEGWDFSAEEAIYWFCHDWHTGQRCEFYSILSTSPFKPSPLHSGIEDSDDYLSVDMYNELVNNYVPGMEFKPTEE